MSLSRILNEGDFQPLLVDIQPDLAEISSLVTRTQGPMLVPSDVASAVSTLLGNLRQCFGQTSTAGPSSLPSTPQSSRRSSRNATPASSRTYRPSDTANHRVEHDVAITRQTIVSVLYTYQDPQCYIEYPETSESHVGYLFERDPNHWELPCENFAYSLGSPKGRSRKHEEKKCLLLKDIDGQGVKICPYTNIEALSEPHTKATLEAIAERLTNDRSSRLEVSTPEYHIYQKTAALISAIRKVGCRGPEFEETILQPSEQVHYDNTREMVRKQMRGYIPTLVRCKGRILLKYDNDLGREKLYLKCEHYQASSRDHYIEYLDESYDLDYIEAYFQEDADELDRIEQIAFGSGYGPLTDCSTVSNVSSQK
ncbi:hypothetical protein H0H92_007812, partial [Tricholoma furcatifolium]